MRDLSLHLLDLAQNSIRAGASLVQVRLALDENSVFTLELTDDGCGMDQQTLDGALSPFGTSRTTRKVGMGIPLTQEHALGSGGSFRLESQKGQGTRLMASFDTHHLDCPPLGSLADSLSALLLGNPEKPDFSLELSSPRGQEQLDTRDIKRALDPIPLSAPEAAQWLCDNLNEMAEKLFGGLFA